ncbi:PerC family transcriptional regulator [Erwinia sp. CPCC 100877]|nr:PerC family transcriptional regulator [Erwinia sp. CPCC 100877]
MIKDSKAEALEAKGMYRRAASRWLEVFDQCDSEAGREWIKKHRNECLERRKRPTARLDNYGDLRKAVDETQRRMGLNNPNGGVFRLKGKRRH